MTGSKSEISFAPMPADDPTRRRPDIALARRSLGWEPAIDLRTGLESTIPYFAAALAGATS
jgi:UDP-glucuronate decarboxylase